MIDYRIRKTIELILQVEIKYKKGPVHVCVHVYLAKLTKLRRVVSISWITEKIIKFSIMSNYITRKVKKYYYNYSFQTANVIFYIELVLKKWSSHKR